MMLVTTSWDDGHPLDLRTAEMLSEYGHGGTFYVPLSFPGKPVADASSLRALASRFEIGGHTRNHVDLPTASEGALREEIRGGKMELEDLLGKPVTVFCYPRGHHNARVRRAVAEAGFAGARTTKELCIELGSDPWKMPTTLHAFPHRSWIRARHAVRCGSWSGLSQLLRAGPHKQWVELAKLFFDMMLKNEAGVWHLWGHSWEIEQHNLWNDLRAVLEYVSKREGVTYVSNSEAIRGLQPETQAIKLEQTEMRRNK